MAGGGVALEPTPSPVYGASGVQVSIDAPDEVLKGSDFTATVAIIQVENLDACNYDVSFSSAVLRLDNVTSGDIGGTTIPVDFCNERSPGRYTIVQNVPELLGVTGSGYLAELHFHVIGSEGHSSNISLSSGALSSNLAEEIQATWIEDSVHVYGVDTTSPMVTGTLPQSGAPDVAIDTTIQVTFSEEMNFTSVVSAFSISPAVNGTFISEVEADHPAPMYFGFTPDYNLAYNMTYTVTISTAAQDLVGNGLDGDKDGTPEGSPTDDYIWSFTTQPPELDSIVVTPGDSTIGRGETKQFIATGNYSDGSTADITNEVIWASSNLSVATIQNKGQANPGRATGVALGITVITAKLVDPVTGLLITSPGVTLAVIVGATVEINSGHKIILPQGGSQSNIPVDIKGIVVSQGAEGLAAFDFRLNWEPDVIHVDSLTTTMDAMMRGFTPIIGTPDNVNGTVTLVGATTGYSTDDLTIVTLKITAVGNVGDSTSIDITITDLADNKWQQITPRTPVSAPVTLASLVAETSVSQAKDGDGVVVVKVNIDRSKDPSTGNATEIPGGIGSYTAMAVASGSGIKFITVRGVSPFNSPSFNATTGVFSVAVVSSPPQADNTTVAKVVSILTGNTTTLYNLTIAFQVISAAGEPGLNIPEEHPNYIVLLRGDADNSGHISIVDALAIQQYLVGQLVLGGINPLNAASPNHDGVDGDKISVVDALAIQQYLVGQLNAYFE